jgi:DNA-binding NtrC family response regulator
MVAAGTFRSDLYHRLNVIQLRLPPLRERSEDLAPLVLEFARRHAHLHEGIASLEPELVQHLQSYPFNGNVRELENAVQRMLFHKSDGDSLSRSDWLDQQPSSSDAGQNGEDEIAQAANLLWLAMRKQGLALPEVLRRAESEVLGKALQLQGKTRREIAEMLQTSERTLYHKLNSHRNIEGPTRRAG